MLSDKELLHRKTVYVSPSAKAESVLISFGRQKGDLKSNPPFEELGLMRIRAEKLVDSPLEFFDPGAPFNMPSNSKSAIVALDERYLYILTEDASGKRKVFHKEIPHHFSIFSPLGNNEIAKIRFTPQKGV